MGSKGIETEASKGDGSFELTGRRTQVFARTKDLVHEYSVLTFGFENNQASVGDILRRKLELEQKIVDSFEGLFSGLDEELQKMGEELYVEFQGLKECWYADGDDRYDFAEANFNRTYRRPNLADALAAVGDYCVMVDVIERDPENTELLILLAKRATEASRALVAARANGYVIDATNDRFLEARGKIGALLRKRRRV